jgi:hypothetical protein
LKKFNFTNYYNSAATAAATTTKNNKQQPLPHPYPRRLQVQDKKKTVNLITSAQSLQHVLMI